MLSIGDQGDAYLKNGGDFNASYFNWLVMGVTFLACFPVFIAGQSPASWRTKKRKTHPTNQRSHSNPRCLVGGSLLSLCIACLSSRKMLLWTEFTARQLLLVLSLPFRLWGIIFHLFMFSHSSYSIAEKLRVPCIPIYTLPRTIHFLYLPFTSSYLLQSFPQRSFLILRLISLEHILF